MNLHNKEIEIKLLLQNTAEAEQLKMYLNSLAQAQAAGELQTTIMRAVYYDTDDGFLHQHRIAYRIRQENKNIVATYKSEIRKKDDVFIRVEVNKNVKSLRPDIGVFAAEKDVWDVLKSVENSRFVPIVETDFVRSSTVINWHGSEIEAAVDLGEIRAKNKKSPICELELELKSGDENMLLSLQKEIEKSFALTASDISKYHRGLILAGLA